MNYSEGIRHILSLVGENGSFSPFADIVIHYPGRGKKGDYRLTVQGGEAPTHAQMSRRLYNLINGNNYSYQQLKHLLSDIHSNGTNTDYIDLNLKYLQHLIYWITLQEEINFPRSKGKSGINLAFCRYLEAIYSSQPLSNFTIEDVEARCNNYGQPKPPLYIINDSPDFYHY